MIRADRAFPDHSRTGKDHAAMGIAAIQRSTELDGELASLVAQVRQSVALVYHRRGNGAGVIWRADGHIVTNNHVAGEGRVQIVLHDGRQFIGIVAARHPTRDIAIVKVAAEDLPAATIGDSSRVRPGQIAVAIGHPAGYRDAATLGIVVAAGQASTPDGLQTGDHLQADVAIAPGSSGGPLVDVNGHVIGINTMVAGRLALAIPSNAVDRFVEGRTAAQSTGYLGISGTIAPLRRPDAAFGVVITAVEEGSPADRAGLIVGDVVIAIGSTPVTDEESLPGAVLRMTPGEPVEIHVLRGGDPRTFTVVPTVRP
jgi:serine protease Do